MNLGLTGQSLLGASTSLHWLVEFTIISDEDQPAQVWKTETEAARAPRQQSTEFVHPTESSIRGTLAPPGWG